MKRLFFIILLILFFLPGCTRNIRNVSTDISSNESILVGRIETVPVLWEFSLYEEKSQTQDQIDIEGEGFGLTKARKLQNQGYVFKVVRPGIYVLRVQKKIEGGYDQDNILRFEVPEGKLVYFGTIKIVIDKIMVPSLPGNRMPNVASMKFNYHYAGIDEDETLKLFADQYPQAYSSYKDKIIRVLFSSRSKTHVTLIPGDYSADTGMEPAVAWTRLLPPSRRATLTQSW
ncbi:MAG TPA: hypothetical protein VFG29_03360 [Syntrophales bacterium]|nr:hypothetical protein [Syntrophales bacterium]